MRFKLKYCGFAFLAMGFGLVHGNAPQRMGNYDFSYEVSGDYRVKPVQVFDNGTSTFFQFRAGEPVPAIFVNGPAGHMMQHPEMEGPYTRVSGVARHYTLRLGRGQGSVSYAGSEPMPVSAQPAQIASTGPAFAPVVQAGMPTQDTQSSAFRPRGMDRLLAAAGGIENMPRSVFEESPQPRIAVDINSYATPVRGDIAQFQPTGVSPTVSASPSFANSASNRAPGSESFGAAQRLQEVNVVFAIGVTKLGGKGLDAVRGLAKRYTMGSRFEVVGRYDANYKEGIAEARAQSVAAQLVANGVPKEFISVMTTESLIPLPQAGVTTGASVSVRTAADAVKSHAFVDSSQIQEAGLNSLEAQLRSGRLKPSQAAALIEQMRRSTMGHKVQPIAGFQEAQISRWQMRAADVSVQGVLQRWANDAGWQLIWKNGPDVRVSGDAELIRDGFVSAADYLVSQARGYGHKIRAIAYNNKVMVVTAE